MNRGEFQKDESGKSQQAGDKGVFQAEELGIYLSVSMFEIRGMM